MKILKYYKKNGFEFKITERTGNIALAVGVKGKLENYEVIIIQSHEGRTIQGKDFPPAEFPPSNEQWGSAGWTYTNLEQAREKYDKLTKKLSNATS